MISYTAAPHYRKAVGHLDQPKTRLPCLLPLSLQLLLGNLNSHFNTGN